LAFSPNGESLASAGLDRKVKLWDGKGLQERQVFLGHTDRVLSVAFFHKGQAIVSCGRDKTARIWNLATGKEQIKLEGHADGVEMAAVSPDDQFVATASWDRTVRLWEADTGKEKAVFQGARDQPFFAVTFSPLDGKLLAAGATDGTVRIWNVETKEVVSKVYLHAEAVWALAFSPDGKYLASGSSDKTAKLWDVAAAKEEATLITGSSPSAPIAAMAPSPEGRAVVSTAAPKAETKGWLAAVELLGLGITVILLLPLGVWLYVSQSRRAEQHPVPTETASSVISFACSACGKALKARMHLAGKKVKCSRCGKAILVPGTKADEAGRVTL
jgi:WD40 repeat protein/DNA-directed RNA polymerase subunit RPC12/RpoP